MSDIYTASALISFKDFMLLSVIGIAVVLFIIWFLKKKSNENRLRTLQKLQTFVAGRIETEEIKDPFASLPIFDKFTANVLHGELDKTKFTIKDTVEPYWSVLYGARRIWEISMTSRYGVKIRITRKNIAPIPPFLDRIDTLVTGKPVFSERIDELFIRSSNPKLARQFVEMNKTNLKELVRLASEIKLSNCELVFRTERNLSVKEFLEILRKLSAVAMS